MNSWKGVEKGKKKCTERMVHIVFVVYQHEQGLSNENLAVKG